MKDEKLIEVDLAKIEAQIASQDTPDIHKDTAIRIFGQCTPELRCLAKRINYFSLYSIKGN